MLAIAPFNWQTHETYFVVTQRRCTNWGRRRFG